MTPLDAFTVTTEVHGEDRVPLCSEPRDIGVPVPPVPRQHVEEDHQVWQRRFRAVSLVVPYDPLDRSNEPGQRARDRQGVGWDGPRRRSGSPPIAGAAEGPISVPSFQAPFSLINPFAGEKSPVLAT